MLTRGKSVRAELGTAADKQKGSKLKREKNVQTKYCETDKQINK